MRMYQQGDTLRVIFWGHPEKMNESDYIFPQKRMRRLVNSRAQPVFQVTTGNHVVEVPRKLKGHNLEDYQKYLASQNAFTSYVNQGPSKSRVNKRSDERKGFYVSKSREFFNNLKHSAVYDIVTYKKDEEQEIEEDEEEEAPTASPEEQETEIKPTGIPAAKVHPEKLQPTCENTDTKGVSKINKQLKQVKKQLTKLFR